jgi:hypothetical protein
MVNYHMMNNRRFVLTEDEAKKVQLYQLDTLKLVQEFPNKEYEQVKKQLS